LPTKTQWDEIFGAKVSTFPYDSPIPIFRNIPYTPTNAESFVELGWKLKMRGHHFNISFHRPEQ